MRLNRLIVKRWKCIPICNTDLPRQKLITNLYKRRRSRLLNRIGYLRRVIAHDDNIINHYYCYCFSDSSCCLSALLLLALMFLHSDDIYSHFCLSILYIWFTSFFICLVLFSNIFYNKLTGILPNISLFTESKNGWFTPYFVFYYKCRISLYNFYRLFETYNLRNKFSLLFCFKNSENYLLISL